MSPASPWSPLCALKTSGFHIKPQQWLNRELGLTPRIIYWWYKLCSWSRSCSNECKNNLRVRLCTYIILHSEDWTLGTEEEETSPAGGRLQLTKEKSSVISVTIIVFYYLVHFDFTRMDFKEHRNTLFKWSSLFCLHVHPCSGEDICSMEGFTFDTRAEDLRHVWIPLTLKMSISKSQGLEISSWPEGEEVAPV